MNHAAHAEILGRLHDIQRARYVGVHIACGSVIRVRNGDERREVQHRLASCHRDANAMRITHVAGKDLEFPFHFRRTAIEPAPGVERVVIHEGAHVVTGAHERLGEMRADEAVCAGYEDLGHG